MYSGVEIDMLSLGDADSMLVSYWNGFSAHRVLIDGGNKGDAPTVRTFLRNLNISTIDEVFSTHLHDDHSGGLIELLSDTTLTFGKLWCHIPHWHVESIEKVNAALRAAGISEEAESIRKSLATAAAIFKIAKDRKIPHDEPFVGKATGLLQILSPTEDSYRGLVAEFAEADQIKAEDAAKLRYTVQTAMDEAFFKSGLLESSALLTDPHTDPENESSVVSGFTYNGSVFLFTGDVGTSALTTVVSNYQVAGMHWMQIPHHGSRRNLTESLIETLAPKTAFVSASGNDKHPRRAVVNAFKKLGTNVYSTHYPTGTNLRHHFGTVPARDGYYPATALWEANELAKAASG